MEKPAFEIFQLLVAEQNKETITRSCANSYGLNIDKAEEFVCEIATIYQSLVLKQSTTVNQPLSNPALISSFKPIANHQYQFNDSSYSYHFLDNNTYNLIHPLYSHLEQASPSQNTISRYLGKDQDTLVLANDSQFLGNWSFDDEHLFKGKVFFDFLNQAYHKSDTDWLGILHASSIAQNDQCIILVGSSGSGKSTLPSLLAKRGFQFVSDDFTPLGISEEIYPFPLSISVKSSALPSLIQHYPELQESPEFFYSSLGKNVRYLAPNKRDIATKPTTVKGIVFVRYSEEHAAHFGLKDIKQAIGPLITESWLSPEPQNARQFMDWVRTIPCWNLTYSSIDLAERAIKSIISNEPI